MSSYFLSMQRSSMLSGANATYLENFYEDFLDGTEVSTDFLTLFNQLPENGQNAVKHSLLQAKILNYRRATLVLSPPPEHNSGHEKQQAQITTWIGAYRLLGHLQAHIDPLELMPHHDSAELKEATYPALAQIDPATLIDTAGFGEHTSQSLADLKKNLQQVYCGCIGFEFMHISSSTERAWLQQRIEHRMLQKTLSSTEQQRILERLIAAESLEKYLGAQYPGAKRFGLEGAESLIVSLDCIVQTAARHEVKEILVGMAHRGRLNVLVNVFGKKPQELFDEFEGKHNTTLTSGDVKYHQGFSTDIATPEGNLHMSLAFNPSHLEIVSPVVCGSARARTERRHTCAHHVLPLLIHGDSAFAGQGVVMELLNMSATRGYSNGGSVHVIINNQIGFTTSKVEDTRSTLYCSDIGKMMQIPIFHVNGDCPEEVALVSQLAVEYRHAFKKDVIIDLVCYRKHGHNEADEPMVTQPIMYRTIKQKKSPCEKYTAALVSAGTVTAATAQKIAQDYRHQLAQRDQATVAKNIIKWQSGFAADWSPYLCQDWRMPVKTGVSQDTLKRLAEQRDTLPDHFQVHSRVAKIIQDRRRMTAGDIKLDWGYAETLAYATLLTEGYPVRLSGQDCGRGTFFHRHAVHHEQTTGQAYIPLCHLETKQAPFWVIDSLLSESAVLAYEYGFSTSEPQALVIWEAQFGDFANNAQVVFDQFISSGEHKWGRLSGLTLFLPHGYEGQGPEHSSARLERYLQGCAGHNIQVCIPTTPAQTFHMLRRQVLRPVRKPLIVLTPKSLLRHPQATSTLAELEQGKFRPILADDQDRQEATRAVLCSGKVYYDLQAKRDEHGLVIPLIRIEQLYPFPETELQAILAGYPHLKEIVWCQEEPQNQGAWYCSQHHIRACLSPTQKLHFAGRAASAAPAVGYYNLHIQEQEQLVQDALGLT